MLLAQPCHPTLSLRKKGKKEESPPLILHQERGVQWLICWEKCTLPRWGQQSLCMIRCLKMYKDTEDNHVLQQSATLWTGGGPKRLSSPILPNLLSATWQPLARQCPVSMSSPQLGTLSLSRGLLLTLRVLMSSSF